MTFEATRKLRIVSWPMCPMCNRVESNPNDPRWAVEEQVEYRKGGNLLTTPWVKVIDNVILAEAQAVYVAHYNSPIPSPPEEFLQAAGA